MSATNVDRYRAVGQTIKAYRIKKGFTQEELADRASISISYLTKIEAPNTDKSFSLEALFAISDALDIPASRFLEDI
jgi:transcriptional regulator with XRE-family HTH domain